MDPELKESQFSLKERKARLKSDTLKKQGALSPEREDLENTKNPRGKAGIEGHSIHDLRHTTAIRLAENEDNGISPFELRNWMRRRTIQSTEIYFDKAQFKKSNKKAQAVLG